MQQVLRTPKPTSFMFPRVCFDIISIKRKCVQNVKELLGISKELEEIINFLYISKEDSSFFYGQNVLLFIIMQIKRLVIAGYRKDW